MAGDFVEVHPVVVLHVEVHVPEGQLHLFTQIEYVNGLSRETELNKLCCVVIRKNTADKK